MKITRRQLRQLIKEELEIHLVPEDIGMMDPEETYGMGDYKDEDSHCCSGCSGSEQNQCCNKQKHDNEGKMIKSQLYRIMKHTTELYDMINDNDDLPEWVQNKITKATEHMNTVYNYMDSKENRPESLGHM